MSDRPEETGKFLSFARGREQRDIDGWAGLVLRAWEEISELSTPEEAIERIARAGFDPPEFIRTVRAAEEWKRSRGGRFRPQRAGGPAHAAERYDFRVEPAGRRFRAAIVDRCSGETLWERRVYTRARALGEMTREALRLPDAGGRLSERGVEIESAGVWLDAAEEENRTAAACGDPRRRALASADVASAREHYVRLVTGTPPKDATGQPTP